MVIFFFNAPFLQWGPRKFLICGEIGDSSRLNDDGVIGQCDLLVDD